MDSILESSIIAKFHVGHMICSVAKCVIVVNLLAFHPSRLKTDKAS